MLDPAETAFLQSIAKDHAENTARLAFADYLDEHDQSPRAEFIRVQCELASKKLAKKRKQTLQVRERELLDAHWQTWCESFELALESAAFERGLINTVRLTKWDRGKLLKPEFMGQFATLTELDLSGMKLGDAGLTAFAEKAQFPALRTLIVSDNGITDTGAATLATATGLPKLDTIYLFGNSVSAGIRTTLEWSKHFKLKNLDLGEVEEGYAMTPGQTDMARRQHIRRVLAVVTKHFEKYPKLQSAALCVAQYWADEADDAVHQTLVVSELFEPTLKCLDDGDDESHVDPNIPNTHIKSRWSERSSSQISLWDQAPWDSNGDAIPVWAAFAPENGSQEFSQLDEVYLPAVMFYRHGGYDILPMERKHLDGIRPTEDYG